MNLTIGSLFSGIGGLELGLERSGLGRVVWQVEIDSHRRKVLAKHWPDTPRWGDISSFQGAPADAICGGFPCQNLSHANVKTRSGLSGDKSGLWREFKRIVHVVMPSLVIVENVRDGWRRWVPAVRCDLGRLGYSSVSLCLRACDVGAPFEGARVFVVATANRKGKPAFAVNAEVAKLREATEAVRKNWGEPTPRALGMADGIPDRMERLGALGNAVVPAMAEVVGRLIQGSRPDNGVGR